jgi:hypothetical protein
MSLAPSFRDFRAFSLYSWVFEPCKVVAAKPAFTKKLATASVSVLSVTKMMIGG